MPEISGGLGGPQIHNSVKAYDEELKKKRSHQKDGLNLKDVGFIPELFNRVEQLERFIEALRGRLERLENEGDLAGSAFSDGKL